MIRTTIFQNQGDDVVRIPQVVVGTDGTVHAFCNLRIGTAEDHAAETRILYARKPWNGHWSTPTVLVYLPGWSCMIGSACVDDATGKVFCLYKKIAAVQPEFANVESPSDRQERAKNRELQDGIREGDYILESENGGLTFTDRKILIRHSVLSPFATGFSHGSGSGMTLHYGPNKGRIILPARMSLHPVHTWDDLKTGSTNTVLYSDDHANTFSTGGIVEPGTGEGAVCECSDGNLYYSSRAYFNEGKRHYCVSHDGGLSFAEQGIQNDLIEPCCNADLTRVFGNQSLFFFSNPNSETERIRMRLHYSTDEGRSWNPGLVINEKPSAYSSLAWNEKDQKIYTLFECGEETPYERIDLVEMTIDEAKGQ